MEEKLWLVSHHEKNPKITQAKIGLDFSAKFKRTRRRIDNSRIGSRKQRAYITEKTANSDFNHNFFDQKINHKNGYFQV